MLAYISRSMRGLEILILRHGQSEGNEAGRFGGHGPTPLTAFGREQALWVARALADEGGLTAIYTSDLPRAVETAAPIAHATGIAAQRTAALRERSVGVFTGLTFGEAEAQYPDAFAALMRREADARPPEGETHGEAAARAVALLDDVLARYAAGRVLFVSHALTIYLMLLHVLGLAHASKTLFLRTDNCALHRLRRSPEGLWTVLALNDKAHLARVQKFD
jgi:broad specificity phosphatase PhoE